MKQRLIHSTKTVLAALLWLACVGGFAYWLDANPLLIGMISLATLHFDHLFDSKEHVG